MTDNTKPAAPAGPSNSPSLPPDTKPTSSSGIRTVLKFTGIPESWLKRPKLPSRNWLIFLGVSSSILGLYVYDRRKCKEYKEEYVRRVQHFAEEPMGSMDLPRKVSVYACKWPGDDDSDRALKYFRKYVRPVLVAAAVDYEVLNGNRHGSLAATIADRIKTQRRIDAGLERPPPSINPLPAKLSDEEARKRELEGGIVIVGRHTFKEYMEGLRRGWTESPVKIDREEQLAHLLEDDGRFDEPEVEAPAVGDDVEGEPIPTKTRLPPSQNMSAFSPLKLPGSSAQMQPSPSSSLKETSTVDIPSPSTIPIQPPLLLVPFTNLIGLRQIPLMLWEFFNERHKVLAGSQAGYRIVTNCTRPIEVPSPSTISAHDSFYSPPPSSGTHQPQNDLEFDRESESYYKPYLKKFESEIEQAREDYYKALPKKLETARALARGTRESTKDETKFPPPTEVELRAERLKKELRWRSDLEGWGIIKPETEVSWDERFRSALRVFVDCPAQEQEHRDEPTLTLYKNE